jgi:dTDP-4-dehydrorhamnose reductase
VNVYGSTKLAGERAVLEDDPTTLVIHTTGVFGPEKQGKNFVYQLCNAFAEKKDMDCARDSFGSPTYNRDLAVMTVSLLEARATGIYHGVGPETLDRHSFAMLIADTFGLDSKFVKSFNSQALNQNTVDRLGFAARRGKHLGLSNQKVKDALLISCHHRSITAALQHWKDSPRGVECKF